MKSMLHPGRVAAGRRIMRRALVVATALVFGAPATLAFAHDPGDYQGFFNHFYDHLEHQRFHQQFNEEHNAAHWRGFDNPRQHEDWHRAPTEPRTGNFMRTIQLRGMIILTVTAITNIART